MFKQFLKDSAIYGLASVLAKGVSLLLLPFYVRELSLTDFGITDILQVFTALVSLTIALEVTQAVAIYYTETQNIKDKVGYASTALWFTMGVYSIFGVLCLLFAAPLSQLILDSDQTTLIFQVGVLSTISYGLLYLAMNQLRWQLQPTQYAITSLTTTLSTIGITILLVLVFHLGVLGVLMGQFCGNTLGAAIALYFGRSSYQFTFAFDKLKEMLRFSVPLVPSSVGVFAMFYIDRIVIRTVMTMADVGVFGVAYRLVSVVNLLMVGFRGALSPLIYSRHQQPETPGEIARIFRFFIALAFLIITGIGLFSQEILIIFATPDYYSAAAIMPILAASLLFGEMYFFAPGLTIAKKTSAIAVINISGAVLTTLLNIIFIPVLGIMGAALANLMTNFLVFISNIFFSQRTYHVPHRWKPTLVAGLFTAGIIYTGYQVNFSFWPALAVKIVLFLLFALSIILLRLVEWNKIIELWQQLPSLINNYKNRFLQKPSTDSYQTKQPNIESDR